MGVGCVPEAELMLMMAPFFFAIKVGSTARVIFTVPSQLIRHMSDSSLGSTSQRVNGSSLPTPTLFTSRPNPPSDANVSETIFSKLA